MLIEEAIKKKTACGLEAGLAILVLVLYVAGSSQIETLHQLLHPRAQIISHSIEQENDPCHRSIHHEDAERGCGHYSHTVVNDKCELCDLIFHPDQLLLSTSVGPASPFVQIDFVSSLPDIVHAGQPIYSSRAPPVL